MLPVSTFAYTVADAIAGGVGGGAVGCGEGVCDLGGLVVGNDEGLRCESALEGQCVSLRMPGGRNGGGTYVAVLHRSLLALSEKLQRPFLKLLL